ncbi:Nucleoside-diphosphate-sugar epimerase [uncultured Alphaproteobacteria bacterium]|uniref:Nucleoside-diphosphate-sugar epimerase n=1 Tax=uncultured Alphaproteobacteria bacterium TaxID=91750 RepID=A0A212KE38_9PROT|nr:Nucleoside-diphosphate-sugar epimerase [uncultured Alphaproteobacteria bacterium]
MKKKALVIGSEGNIGVPLVKHLRGNGYEVLESDIRPGWRDDYLMADINYPVDLLPAFDWKPDVVFLLSAMVSRVTCEQAAGMAISTNLSGINNVLQLCKRVDAMTVFFSTSEVYGPDCNPMDEAISNPKPNNRYGLSKLLGEQLVEYEVRTHGLRAVSLRPFMMYDEEEDLGDHRSAMIRFATNLALGRKIEVHRGSQRGWLHVSDAVRAIEAAAHVTDYAVINIGHPDIVPIDEMAEMVRAKLEADPALITHHDLPDRMTLVKRPKLDRQRDILGVTPKVSLTEGVNRVCTRIRERLAAGEMPQFKF